MTRRASVGALSLRREDQAFSQRARRPRAGTSLLALGVLVALAVSAARPQDTGAAFNGTNGRIVFVSSRDGNYEVYSMNSDGSGQTNLSNNPAGELAPEWSPDGSKIVFTSFRDGNAEIYTMNADGTGQTRLTYNSATDSNPTWSPDGQKIAFRSDRDGGAFEIYTVDVH